MKTQTLFSLVFSLTLVLGACAKSKDPALVDRNPGGSNTVDLNDYSTCSGASPLGISLYNTWTFKEQYDDIKSTTEIKFSQFRVEVTTKCLKNTTDENDGNAEVITLKATSTISVKNGEVQVWFDDEKQEDRFGIKCSSAVHKGTFKYEFRGDCLKMPFRNGVDQLFPLKRVP